MDPPAKYPVGPTCTATGSAAAPQLVYYLQPKDLQLRLNYRYYSVEDLLQGCV